MTEETKRELEQAGIRVDQLLERFMGNEGLAERFLKKFLNDANYGKLMESVQAGDPKGAFEAAHTLKGVAGNLSMQPLMEAVGRMTEDLRNDRWEEALSLMPKVTEAYEKMAAVLRAVF